MRAGAGVLGVGVLLTAVVVSTAGAQTYVGKNIEGGMHWAVAAPQGASWSLECRFPPVTYWENQYDREHWINKLERRGQGSYRGRLPINQGHCYVTKTGGAGPVGIALARPGGVRAEGVNEVSRRVGVGFM